MLQSATSSMYGLSPSSSNHAATCSRSTAGANGRNDSRNLILKFISDCIFGERGSPMIDRAAERAGPELHPALQQADDLPFGEERGHLVGQARPVQRAGLRHPLSSSHASNLIVAEPRAEKRPTHAVGVRGARSSPAGMRGLSVPCARRLARWGAACPDTDAKAQATPTAPPASPAAGWIQISSKGPSRRIRPLPTQLSATPPARHRFAQSRLSVRERCHLQHHFFGDLLDRAGKVHLALCQRRLGLPRGSAEEAANALPVIVRPCG